MAKIARFDRCRTCHQNIDKTATGGFPAFPEGHPSDADVATWVSEDKFPQPYATHSNTELFCTASSPHPVAKFGCTICHDGQGSGTSFGNAEHTPDTPQLAAEWHEEYGYHANHFWEYPMQPTRFAESTCIKCHHGMTELGVNPKFGATAPKAFKGYQLIQNYGCFGCHEIHGQDAGVAIGPDMRVEPQTDEERARIASDPNQVAGKFRKVGPSLRHISSKTNSNWIQYWTEIPSRFRPTTKMPQFFNQSEHLSPADAAHTQTLETVELAGIANVLLGNSQPIDLLKPADGYAADVARGKSYSRNVVVWPVTSTMLCQELRLILDQISAIFTRRSIGMLTIQNSATGCTLGSVNRSVITPARGCQICISMFTWMWMEQHRSIRLQTSRRSC